MHFKLNSRVDTETMIIVAGRGKRHFKLPSKYQELDWRYEHRV